MTWNAAVVTGEAGFETVWNRAATNVLPAALFLSLFVSPVLATRVGALGRLTDGVIALVAVAVVWRMIRSGTARAVPFGYLVVFLLFLYVTAAGAVLNEVASLTAVAGIRSYFKYVPLFLLPFAFRYTGSDLRFQFAILMALAMLQLPVSFWQRFVDQRDVFTGDGITGTLTVSSSLSVLLVSLIAVLTALYLRHKITRTAFVVTSLLLFLPCTINETKVTVFLLPIGIGAVVFVLRREIELRTMALTVLTGLLLVGAFVLVYDQLYAQGSGFLDKVTSSRQVLDNYNLTGTEATKDALRKGDVGIVGSVKFIRTDDTHVGRFDSFQVAAKTLFQHDPTLLVFGLGIGNVDSSIGQGGAFRAVEEQLAGTTTALAQLLWETGLAGTLLFLIFLLLVARDSAVLSAATDGWGAFAAGWFGAVLVTIATLPYTSMFQLNEIPCLFAYFAGVVVCRRRVGGAFDAEARDSGHSYG